jgi:serum/glucocorticoid-regulated kinase 2
VARFYAAQVVLALEHIHALDIVYRDLKPENVLLGADGYLCLADFGLAKEAVRGVADGTSTLCGTAEYMAPEMIDAAGYGKAVDWWAAGVLLYEMLHGLPPFYSENRTEMAMRILSAPLAFEGGVASAACQGLLAGLLDREPARRAGAAAARRHAFFAGVDLGLYPIVTLGK